MPASASARVFATWNMSLFCGFLIANNSVPYAKVPPAVAIPVTVAPVPVVSNLTALLWNNLTPPPSVLKVAAVLLASALIIPI